MSNQDVVAVNDDGTLSRIQIITTALEGNLSQFLTTNQIPPAPPIPVPVPQAPQVHKAVQVGEDLFYKFDENVGFYSAKRLHSLTFKNTNFESYNGTLFMEMSGAEMSLIAPIPDDMHLYIISIKDQTSFLVALSKNTGDAHRLPLWNIYDDGKICMGSNFTSSKFPIYHINAAAEHLESAPWNDDIQDSMDSDEDDDEKDNRDALWTWSDTRSCEFNGLKDWENSSFSFSKAGYNEFIDEIIDLTEFKKIETSEPAGVSVLTDTEELIHVEGQLSYVVRGGEKWYRF